MTVIVDEGEARETFAQALDLFDDGAYTKALHLLEAVLRWAVEQDRSEQEAIARFFLGQILAGADEMEGARTQLTTAHDRFRELGDSAGQARARLELGELAYLERHYDLAVKHFERVLEVLDDAEESEAHAMACARLGAIAAEEDDLEGAYRYYEQALAYHKVAGDTLSAANTTLEFASVLQTRDPERSRRLFERGRDLAQRAGSDYLTSMALHGLGVLHANAEEWKEAQQAYQAALELKERCDDREGEIFTYLALGAAERELGHGHSAHSAWQRALALAEAEEMKDVANAARLLLQESQFE